VADKSKANTGREANVTGSDNSDTHRRIFEQRRRRNFV
jgi:hypothetical protein